MQCSEEICYTNKMTPQCPITTFTMGHLTLHSLIEIHKTFRENFNLQDSQAFLVISLVKYIQLAFTTYWIISHKNNASLVIFLQMDSALFLWQYTDRLRALQSTNSLLINTQKLLAYQMRKTKARTPELQHFTFYGVVKYSFSLQMVCWSVSEMKQTMD